jgi:hypothetical protein
MKVSQTLIKFFNYGRDLTIIKRSEFLPKYSSCLPQLKEKCCNLNKKSSIYYTIGIQPILYIGGFALPIISTSE